MSQVVGGGIVGFLVAGPPGSVVGGIAGGATLDGAITVGDSVVAKDFVPFGYVASVSAIATGSAPRGGALFDLLATAAGDGLTGYAAGQLMSRAVSKPVGARTGQPVALDKLQAGDHIRVDRGAYYHEGIYCGDGEVAHLTGEPFAKSNARPQITSISDFLDGASSVELVSYEECMPVNDTLSFCRDTAAAADGEFPAYHLLSNNCEHYCRTAKAGAACSYQVESATTAGAVTLGVLAGVREDRVVCSTDVQTL